MPCLFSSVNFSSPFVTPLPTVIPIQPVIYVYRIKYSDFFSPKMDFYVSGLCHGYVSFSHEKLIMYLGSVDCVLPFHIIIISTALLLSPVVARRIFLEYFPGTLLKMYPNITSFRFFLNLTRMHS